MHALGARARALALLGRRREAREALKDVETEFERLPRAVMRATTGGWSERRLHHAASFVVAFGGVGSLAHDEALKTNAGRWRYATQIELHRAAGEADARHAVATLTALSAPQRSDRFIRRLGVRTLAICERESVAGVAELREVLSAA